MLTRTMLSVQATPDTSAIRTAQLFNEDHTVIPCIALVEGVLWPANAPAPELALAEEFGRFPDGWNGRPVVYDHPRVNGEAVSASNPQIMEAYALGQLFNTQIVNNKLKVEIWINEERVKNMSEDVQDTVKRLKEGDETIEVSTGLFSMSEIASGEFEGEEFEAIWRNIVPDHLAILPEGVVGACSVADGCGAPRTNNLKPVMRAARMSNKADKTTDNLTTNHECGCTDPKACECGDTDKKGMFQKIMELGGNLFNFRNQSTTLSDQDTRTAIQGALSNQESYFWIMAVFEKGDGAGVFVFESFDTGKLYEMDFSINDAGEVTLGESKTEVRPVTQFVPVSSSADVTDNSEHEDEAENETPEGSIQENSTMNKDQLVQGLIDNASSQFTEDDRDWLSTLEESQLAKLSPVTNEDDGEEEEEDTSVADAAIAANAAKPVSTEDYIKNAPPEIAAVLNDGVRMHSARKQVLVKGLLANKRNQFTEPQLNAKSLTELEQIASLAADISFEGASASLTTQSDGDNAVPAPVQLFDLKSNGRQADAA